MAWASIGFGGPSALIRRGNPAVRIVSSACLFARSKTAKTFHAWVQAKGIGLRPAGNA